MSSSAASCSASAGLVADQRRHPRRRHAARRGCRTQRATQGLEPAQDGRGAAGVDVRQPVGLDEQRGLPRCGPAARSAGSPRRCDRGTRNHSAARACSVLDVLGVRELELAARHGGEEVVEPEPRRAPRPGGRRTGSVAARSWRIVGGVGGVRGRGRTARRRTGRGSRPSMMNSRTSIGMPAEHLLGEVVTDEPVARR